MKNWVVFKVTPGFGKLGGDFGQHENPHFLCRKFCFFGQYCWIYSFWLISVPLHEKYALKTSKTTKTSKNSNFCTNLTWKSTLKDLRSKNRILNLWNTPKALFWQKYLTFIVYYYQIHAFGSRVTLNFQRIWNCPKSPQTMRWLWTTFDPTKIQ